MLTLALHSPADAPSVSDTRQRLLASAIRLFGAHGFDATTVRDIVEDAGQNVSAIKYHFGSKEDLFDACTRAVADRLRQEGAGALIRDGAWRAQATTPDGARDTIRAVIRVVLQDALRPDRADESRFLRREIIHTGRRADPLFDHVLGEHLAFMTGLVDMAEGIGDPTRARARALAIILQVVLLLSSTHILALGMGWSAASDHIADIVDAVYPIHQPGGT